MILSIESQGQRSGQGLFYLPGQIWLCGSYSGSTGTVCILFLGFFLTELGMFKTFSAEFHVIGESWLVKLTGKAVGKRLNVIYPAGLSFKRTKFPVLLLAVTHCVTLGNFFFPPTSFSSPA